MEKSSQAGYTMLEMLVVIVMIGIISALLLRGYPTLRAQQQLKAAEQQLQSTLREAQALALNETREQDCLDPFIFINPDHPDQRLCSDIGVHLKGDTVTLFANIRNDDQDIFDDPGDYVISRSPLAPGTSVVAVNPKTLIFRARPPRVWISSNGNNVDDTALGDIPHTVELAAGTTTVSLDIGSFGQVTRTTP